MIWGKQNEAHSLSDKIMNLVPRPPRDVFSPFFTDPVKNMNPTVNNKKTHPPVFQHFVFLVNLRNRLSYKKYIYIFLHLFLKRFQLKQEFFPYISWTIWAKKNIYTSFYILVWRAFSWKNNFFKSGYKISWHKLKWWMQCAVCYSKTFFDICKSYL